ncbi:MAG TPA: DNA polymerase III subunit delta [Steroidobacteraceae bacterium]|nr:DNA polymerase III subunit delta [Steroidobacteraceae bacterium]
MPPPPLKIKPESLAAHLRERLLPVYLISGDDPLLTGEAVDAVRLRARAIGFGERDVHFMDRGGDWDAVQASVASMSLFAERRIVEVRLPTGRPGVTGAKVLKRVIEGAGADTLLLILTGRLDREAAASEWARAAEERGASLALWPIARAAFPEWLQARARRQQLEIAPEALTVLVERTEGNLLAAAQELAKLALLAVDGRVDAAAVLASSTDSSHFDVAELDRALTQADAPRALRVLAGLRAEEVELPLVLWAAVKGLHAVLAAEAGHAAPRGGYGYNSTPPRRRQLGAPAAALVARAARADAMAKGRMRGDAWDELALLAADLCGKRALTATPRALG